MRRPSVEAGSPAFRAVCGGLDTGGNSDGVDKKEDTYRPPHHHHRRSQRLFKDMLASGTPQTMPASLAATILHAHYIAPQYWLSIPTAEELLDLATVAQIVEVERGTAVRVATLPLHKIGGKRNIKQTKQQPSAAAAAAPSVLAASATTTTTTCCKEEEAEEEAEEEEEEEEEEGSGGGSGGSGSWDVGYAHAIVLRRDEEATHVAEVAKQQRAQAKAVPGTPNAMLAAERLQLAEQALDAIGTAALWRVY